jgi:hypothetical protein
VGRSTGKGALALWVHHFREISWPSDNAIKVQAGVLGHEAVESADEHGQVIVAGTVPLLALFKQTWSSPTRIETV